MIFTRQKENRQSEKSQSCGSGMFCFGSDSGSYFGSGKAGLRLERVARQTRTLFVKLRRYRKFFKTETNAFYNISFSGKFFWKNIFLFILIVHLVEKLWILSEKFCFKLIRDKGCPDADPKWFIPDQDPQHCWTWEVWPHLLWMMPWHPPPSPWWAPAVPSSSTAWTPRWTPAVQQRNQSRYNNNKFHFIYFTSMFINPLTSVPDPWHFGRWGSSDPYGTFTNRSGRSGSGSGSGSCSFRQWTSRRQQKFSFLKVFMLVSFWRYIYSILQK